MLVLKIPIIYFFFFLVSSLSAGEGPWNGEWHGSWKSGAFLLKLEQHGSDVNGSYEPSHGILRGKVENNILHAKTINENNTSGQFSITMSDSQNAFFGNAEYGDWIAGIRVKEDKAFNALEIDPSSPIHVLYSFLAFGNSARAGNYRLLEKAMDTLHFTEEQKKLHFASRIRMAHTFFQILDQCIVNKLAFFKSEDTQKESVLFQQIGSNVSISVDFIQDKLKRIGNIEV